MERYLIPDLDDKAYHRTEQVIKRSRFITSLAYAKTIVEAKSFIALISSEFRDATHNCYAIKACPPRETSQLAYSDDGEPHGTAGQPMLNCLVHAEIGNIVAVVTRYYGGVKLGTGGLQRAYSSSVNMALLSLPTRQKIQLSELTISTDYNKINYIHKLLAKYEAKISQQSYQEKLILTFSLPSDQVQNLKIALEDIRAFIL